MCFSQKLYLQRDYEITLVSNVTPWAVALWMVLNALGTGLSKLAQVSDCQEPTGHSVTVTLWLQMHWPLLHQSSRSVQRVIHPVNSETFALLLHGAQLTPCLSVPLLLAPPPLRLVFFYTENSFSPNSKYVAKNKIK